MVLLLIKKSEDSQFLYETSCSSFVDETTRTVADIQNLRCKLENLCSELEKLLTPATTPTDEISDNSDSNNNNTDTNQTAKLDERVVETIQRSVADARTFLSKVSAISQ